MSESRLNREERIIAMAGGDRELGAELARIFLSHYEGMHQELKAAVMGGDPLEVRRMVHTIEGSLGAMGSLDSISALMELGQAGRDLETSLFLPLFLKYEKAILSSNEMLKEIALSLD
ncbi:hypothetical protein SAMN06275492_101102 [Dethiosulfovibrio salsuginis]|uniref:HPt domain-containing protein n=2 Tax=Dethiosulfovibrio salsuginis TaxID=561720 RepID=A0A1X7I4D8_9BACT|nr:hypothetical protein SAMN06275492_101102 [Dethiosulfovibrio salsuginis]